MDAYAAQNADENSKPIGIVFSLIGLYLHTEENFSGRRVQLAHMQLGKKRKSWLKLIPPEDRGNITVRDVVATSSGPQRDEMIHKWCAAVWAAWKGSREQIIELLAKELDIK